jgi:hypothetical protein
MNVGKDASRSWSRILILTLFAYSVFGLLIEAATPHLLPQTAFTKYVGGAANAGVFAVWFYLAWRIFSALRGIYGPDGARYFERTSIGRIIFQVTAAYILAAFCFAVLYVYIGRQDPGAFSDRLKLGDAFYFSLVTMTTAGYGDILPKSGLARAVVCVQILFGVLYNVLFFSIFAGLAGRRREG